MFGRFGLWCLALGSRLSVLVLKVMYRRDWERLWWDVFVYFTYLLHRVLLVSHLRNRFLLGSGMSSVDEM